MIRTVGKIWINLTIETQPNRVQIAIVFKGDIVFDDLILKILFLKVILYLMT
jgi:hypothetical protein